MTLAGDMPIADLVARGKKDGVRIYPSLYPRTSWRLPFPPIAANRYASVAVSCDATLEEIRGAAANYRAMGADGFYLFNFYNTFGSTRPHNEKLLHVFRDLARAENLPGQPVVYAVTKSYYHDGPGSYAYGKQLPAKFPATGALRVVLDIAENLAAVPFPLMTCELRLGFRGLAGDAKLVVKLNETVVFDGPIEGGEHYATRQIAKSAPTQPDLADDYLHVPLLSPKLVARGENVFAISLARGTKPAEVTDLEVRYDYQNDYEKLWERAPVELNRPAAGGTPKN